MRIQSSITFAIDSFPTSIQHSQDDTEARARSTMTTAISGCMIAVSACSLNRVPSPCAPTPSQLILGACTPMLILSVRVRYEAFRDLRTRDTDAAPASDAAENK
jgi:hypothetical protein